MGFGDCIAFAEHLEEAVNNHLDKSNTVDWKHMCVDNQCFQAKFSCYFSTDRMCPFRVKCTVEVWPEVMCHGITRDEMRHSKFKDRVFKTSSMVQLVRMLNLIMEQARVDWLRLERPGVAIEWDRDGYAVGEELIRFKPNLIAHRLRLLKPTDQPHRKQKVQAMCKADNDADPNIFNNPKAAFEQCILM